MEFNNLYGWVMTQKRPLNKFEWIEDTSQFNEDFIENYKEKIDKDIFSKLIFIIQENVMNFIMICLFY